MPTKLRPGDIISYEGRDYQVEGVLGYKLAGKVHQLARGVDADNDDAVIWVEPLMGDIDDRMLVFREAGDVPLATPPPATIAYRGQSYLPRFSGGATVTVDGVTPGRTAGPCDVWRYRAAGDIYLQIEKWPGTTVALAGESVHKDMLTILPAP